MLRTLQGRKIIWAGDLITLSWHHGDVYQDEVGIMARIEPDGIDFYFKIKGNYDPLKEEKTKQEAAIYISGDNYGPVTGIGDQNHNLSTFAPHLPKETPAPKTTNSIIKKVAVSIGKFLWEHIWKIIVGILTAYILLKLGLKK